MPFLIKLVGIKIMELNKKQLLGITWLTGITSSAIASAITPSLVFFLREEKHYSAGNILLADLTGMAIMNAAIILFGTITTVCATPSGNTSLDPRVHDESIASVDFDAHTKSYSKFFFSLTVVTQNFFSLPIAQPILHHLLRLPSHSSDLFFSGLMVLLVKLLITFAGFGLYSSLGPKISGCIKKRRRGHATKDEEQKILPSTTLPSLQQSHS